MTTPGEGQHPPDLVDLDPPLADPPPATDPVSVEAWLGALPAAHRSGRAPATWRAYAKDLAHFAGWCETQGRDPLPTDGPTVAAYLEAHGELLTLSTLRRRLAAISVAHSLIGITRPTAADEVHATWKRLRRRYGPTQQVRRVEAVLTRTLGDLVAPLQEDSVMDARDRALLVVGFAGALRRSELAALDVEDVARTPEGLRVTVRGRDDGQGKGDGGRRQVDLPWGEHRATCPVRSWETWASLAGLTTGPAFRSMTKGGRSLKPRRMTGEAIADVVKRRAAAIGMDPATVAGHSLRSGFVASAVRYGVPDRSIMRQSGHRSPASLTAYAQGAVVPQENPASRVGL
ncbi:tyrosine-type recombinase/integrase [Kineococcus esterisolvens]|uniref:tyrosine-type recombinase/integrase n=1 Tax=unclassified Kineococcus TaxID=2621656 RepID=UPI003D7E215F